MDKYTKAVLAEVGVFLIGCSAPSKPQVEYASENSISILYHSYGYTPTVTAEARQ